MADIMRYLAVRIRCKESAVKSKGLNPDEVADMTQDTFIDAAETIMKDLDRDASIIIASDRNPKMSIARWFY